MRLKEVPFTDLYISHAGQCRIRGMQTPRAGGKDEEKQTGESLAPPPSFLKADIKNLVAAISKMAKGDEEFIVPYDGVNYRVSMIPDIGGAWFAVRKAASVVPKLADLQFPTALREKLLDAGAPGRSGLILISGPTGSGKTTTASALLVDYLERYGGVAVTIEEPPELPLSGPHGENGNGWCFQLPVNDGDFAEPLKRTMRYQPRYIMIGEIRSPLATKILLRASVNGHIVISTMHAGSIAETISGVLTYLEGPESEYMAGVLSNGLIAIVNQTLIGKPKRLTASTLVKDDNFGIGAKIRGCHFEQLNSDIERQTRALVGEAKSNLNGKGKAG